jgi:hypothetical protein
MPRRGRSPVGQFADLAAGGLAVENPLQLNDDELDAIRGLQLGRNRVGADDPIWDGLEELGLVDLRTGLIPKLTLLGERYRTD